MSFDYGSVDLGLKNPFKLEGLVTLVRGVVLTAAAVWLLIYAAGQVQPALAEAWVWLITGAWMLLAGLRACMTGSFAMFRFFVGRSQPSSLARNFAAADGQIADQERSYVAYNSAQLEDMLVGRVNPTFMEPQGYIARLLHSLFPKLLFLPYPLRNLAQNMILSWLRTLLALVSYGLVSFVVLSGFAGEAGRQAYPFYSVILMLYLIQCWKDLSGKKQDRRRRNKAGVFDYRELGRVIMLSVFVPVLAGWVISAVSHLIWGADAIRQLSVALAGLKPLWFICGTLLTGVAVSVITGFLMLVRSRQVEARTDVSELRENWQESVHPQEIFINLDSLVMANRRYREIPNRVYKELKPDLKEQVDGKGSFAGTLIQEVQPQVKEVEYGSGFIATRLLALVAGNMLWLVAGFMAWQCAGRVTDLIRVPAGQLWQLSTLLTHGVPLLHYVLAMVIVMLFARLLCRAAHLFFAEIRFESLMVYFRCDGTFTESKIYTGMAIHDSTRSENTLVRSSITPWVITSRFVSSVYADYGFRNLEFPRYVLEMYKADDELQSIRADILAFLKNRESIAAITNEKDLMNTSQIHQLNQQSRAVMSEPGRVDSVEAQAAARIRDEAENNGTSAGTDSDPLPPGDRDRS